ncbi:putative FAD binding domain-containing protein [Rosellinia necatrix]|uniref:Putative FAD binding domain-containing protein n=1 Tax=Rosellinia necatrix TaxID=77044 RepID=A0A1S7UL88_ROSNE|nr:putative FAD binding domain-containing protein [Rosellinia necatrix]
MVSEATVLSALAAYREHIAALNYRAMSAIIPQIEEATMKDDPDIFESTEKEDSYRREYTLQLLGAYLHNTQPPIERPSDVLRHWDIIAPQVGLDGTSVHHDSAWRAERRDAYRAAVLRGLERIECPTGTWALPTDFDIIMRHADSLEGPGWRLLRDTTEQLIFWEGWGMLGCHDVDVDKVEKSVRNGCDIIDQTIGIDEQYDVAGGWTFGSGNEVACYAMYSQGLEEEDWSWRYVVSLGQFGIEVFDDIAALLDWYKTYGEPNDSDFEVIPDDVFQR